MTTERRKDNGEILEKVTTLVVEVKGINKRLDGINGTVVEYNRTCPVYRKTVDDIGETLKSFIPQISQINTDCFY